MMPFPSHPLDDWRKPSKEALDKGKRQPSSYQGVFVAGLDRQAVGCHPHDYSQT